MKSTHRVTKNARAIVPAATRKLTALEYQELADVPAEAEWFANIANEGTRRVYKNDITEFMRFIGILQAAEFRTVDRKSTRLNSSHSS